MKFVTTDREGRVLTVQRVGNWWMGHYANQPVGVWFTVYKEKTAATRPPAKR